MSVPKATLLAAIVVDMVMLALPSKLVAEAVTSPLSVIVRAVSKAVAVVAFPTAKSNVPSES